MAYDIQVLVQSLVYFVIFLCGFVVAVPLGVTVVEFDNHCILYTKWHWKNATFAVYELNNPAACNFPVFSAVFTCILYSLGMAIYHAYAAFKSKDPNVGFQMWSMPFLLVNTLIAMLMFVSSCVISVGLKEMCDGLLEGQKLGSKLKSCSDGVYMDWNKVSNTDYTYSHFYSFPKVSEAAGWITFLLWGVQVGLCIVRAVRNRRLRSQGMDPQPTSGTAGASKTPDDLDNFAAQPPTA
ncbi:transmembrane protein 179B [Aplysia californica]|uniref:Transmembrane protein 179B n=1 Tax=Aplysia californica TaxID=6500 RepID=A0ABM1VV56_APLCA|nr:transmembrane protein 179B [Aplysia californica]XP_005100950.1 transmembrane protein 179B [Aplysia californica]XP_035826298.1 transmembrane protein 179B [Aplysia californica]